MVQRSEWSHEKHIRRDWVSWHCLKVVEVWQRKTAHALRDCLPIESATICRMQSRKLVLEEGERLWIWDRQREALQNVSTSV